eukprot:CAMPEP_0196791540 /NCGR_PEP_ID=MMETSP1104-20130614/30013_1 /TAXON_ID=33652 /ORGANISM="Cafeteria sp., Strain Caron Lab Isolate" /LENGTH=55 /DNA_ID=CAMNT_0042161905 /DNA_START=26 /DNA_END=190 /DNA_ORIENTATION=-
MQGSDTLPTSSKNPGRHRPQVYWSGLHGVRCKTRQHSTPSGSRQSPFSATRSWST